MYVTVPVFASNTFKDELAIDDKNCHSDPGVLSPQEENSNNIQLTDTLVDSEAPNKITLLRAIIVFLHQNIGVALLSIPYCFNTGYVLNSFVLIILGLFAITSFILLVDCSVTTQKSIDYATFMRLSFPKSKYNFDWIPLVIITITLFGCCILHLQYACSIIQTFFKDLDSDGVESIPKWMYNRWLLICVPAITIDLPLTFLRSIRALSYASVITMFLMFLYLIHCFYIFGMRMKDLPKHKLQGVKAFEFNRYFIPSIAIQAFAFTFNMEVTPTIEKLRRPTRKRQYKTFAWVVGISGIIYFISGIFPYLALVPNIRDPIVFDDFPYGRVFTIIIKFVLALFLIITTPLYLFSCRIAFNDATFRSPFTALRWNLIGISILVVSVVIACAVKSITTVFGFIGGVTSTACAYILPAIYYLRICKNESLVKTVFAWILLVGGGIILVFCLYDSLRSCIVGGD